MIRLVEMMYMRFPLSLRNVEDLLFERGINKANSGRFNVTTLEPMREDLHERLSGVVIKQLPYGDVIRRYDNPSSLFDLNPPYWGSEGDYGEGIFNRVDFERLADQLASIAGGFVLSINGTDGAREVFSRFACDEVETTWAIAMAMTGSGRRVKELIVRG